MIENIFESNSRINTNYENDEDRNEGVLDQSFDKNDVDIDFFDNQNDNKMNDIEIEPDEIYMAQKKEETKDKKNNSFMGNTSNIGSSRTSLTITKTKSTKVEIQKKIKNIPANSAKIFKINKVNKKLGRIRKTKTKIKGKHNKNSEDNIIQKIKASFQESIFNYINHKYEEYLKNNNIEKPKLIKRISPEESKKIKKDDNLRWFSFKLKDLFSKELSSKYTKFGKNYNKNNIDILYKENKAKDVINILEKTVREMFKDFCNDTPIDGFETLKHDLDTQKQKMEEENEDNIEEYLKKYKDIAQNLEQIFILKKSRGNKKKRD